MKLKIKVKELTENCMPIIIKKGDLIDLKAAGNYSFNGPTIEDNKIIFDEQVVSLGVAMELPKGMMAKLRGRSSLTKKHGVIPTSSGEIDNSYNGNEDEWMLRLCAIKEGHINKYDRIAQFEVVPSQKATWWQKLKWLFSSGVKLVKVDNLQENSRGGFGSTGVK